VKVICDSPFWSVCELPELSVASPLITVQMIGCPDNEVLPGTPSCTTSGASETLPITPL
jgi:hypothetical protein